MNTIIRKSRIPLIAGSSSGVAGKKNNEQEYTTISTAGIFAAAGCLLLLFAPQIALKAAQKGLQLWWNTVLPAMLPFFIFTDLMVQSGGYRMVGHFLERPVKALFRVPGEAAVVLAASLLSGYPTGARMTGALLQQGSINAAEAQRMLNFCTTSGPMFVISALGIGMLRDEAAGRLILAAHYLGTLLTGILLNSGEAVSPGKSERKRMDTKIFNRSIACIPFMESLTNALFRSLKSMGLIGGFIMLFTILSELFVQGSSLLTDMLSGAEDCRESNLMQWIVLFLSGFLEMTTGCSRTAECTELSMECRLLLCTFFLSFGGLSVLAQTSAVLQDRRLSMKKYTSAKLLHGILSVLIMEILLLTQD